VQLRAFDTSRSGAGLGLGTLLALCSALLEKGLKGGLVAVGSLNLGGAIDPVYNAVGIAELAVEKGASTLLMPVSARKQLFDLSDDMATKITVQFYADAREALLKALGD
jgi:ATP-dependent Lon protease